jgi:crotonobetainyl-CoA:carnitine CoA-transferase CaiB-like acyl-CoA transferase
MKSENDKMFAPKPLEGLKVLDFSRILSGPYATLVLADLGAEVIKIETLEKGDETRGFPPFNGPFSHYFIGLNRGKKSLSLNLKDERGVEIAKALARQCDVVVENFRPGVMEKLGLGYDVLSLENPSLCYCSISGFGNDSPLRDAPAFDIVAQALSGIMTINREPGTPPNKLGIPLGDMAGSIFALFGILAALYQRQTTSKGQKIDIAMLDSLIGMLGYLAQIFFVTGKAPQPVGTKHPSIVPYGAYPTSNGHVIVACLTEQFWQNFARSLDLEDLIEDPRFDQYTVRLENRAELEAIVNRQMERHDNAFWLKRLADFDVPSAPILDVAQALTQPHVIARGLVGKMSHDTAGEMAYIHTPIVFSGSSAGNSTPPPLLGEQSRKILSEMLKLDDEIISRLISDSIVQQS